MSNPMPIVINTEEGDSFTHGELTIKPAYSWAERPVEASIHLVIERGREYEFKRELEELIAKYAL